MITVTIAKEGSTTITGAPVLGLSSSMLAAPLRAATPATTSSACVADVHIGDSIQTYTFVESYATVLAALTTDEAESGAEVTTNKVTSVSGASTDVQYPSAKLLYDQLALKAPLASPTFTGNPVVPTQAAGNDSTRAASTAFVEARAKQTPFGTSSSAANTYVVTLAPAVSLSTGLHILLKCTNANTGAATLDLDGVTAAPIVRRDGSTALSSGDLPAGKYVPMFYDGTSWVAYMIG